MMGELMLCLPSESEIKISRSETLRYLGYKAPPDNTALALIERYEAELRRVITPRYCAMTLDIDHAEDGRIRLEKIAIGSRDLKKNLDGAARAIIFAATLGAAADRLIASLCARGGAAGVICNALADAAIEGLCDLANERLTEGYISRPRFSAGYGDLPLSLQKDIVSLLNTQKHIGVTLTESLMLAPSKSVTAIIGIKDIEKKND